MSLSLVSYVLGYNVGLWWIIWCSTPTQITWDYFANPQYSIILGQCNPWIRNGSTMCIVKGEQIKAEYVALSYQWGQTETLRNTIGVRERLLKPYSLSDQEFASKIPQTTQDDHVQLTAELYRMHRIYNSASFTIVAADGSDASYGLRGLEGLTAARKHPQMPIQLAGSEVPGADPLSYKSITFQEFHFSLRRSIFANDALEWHYEHGQMREDVIMELPKPGDHKFVRLSRQPTADQWLGTAMPTPSSMVDLVNTYNILNMSFPEDAFPAFAGVQSLFERLYQPGFLYELPEFWFDIVLCWTPAHVSRRVGRHEAASSGYSNRSSPQLPSWSWIGWAGSVHFPSDETLADGFTEPITKWYTLAHPTSLERRPINSAWYQYRSRTADGHLVTLPEGWKQCTDQERGIMFSHIRRPYAHYVYPFPVPEPSSANVNVSVPRTTYLFAQTTRAFLYGRQGHMNPDASRVQHPL
ncbi:hypothetical protein G6011_08223 [Alternaria panax]|uniref:Uncharacterized protein n=1 Tax=Alternaria panax TaxID=48097 RepID=A0AAD4FHM0_9PLEO|nr:hypothetical protein G6011_08223 [Alternaria panax]